MVIAMAIMWMMQVAVDDVIGMTAVRDRVMAAIRLMGVLTRVSSAGMSRRAIGRIRAAFRDYVLVHVSIVRAVKMTLVQIIDVTLVLDRLMPAARTMLMRMLIVRAVIHFEPRLKNWICGSGAIPIDCEPSLNLMMEEREPFRAER